METIKTETKYIAFDGKEFFDRDLCLSYERELKAQEILKNNEKVFILISEGYWSEVGYGSRQSTSILNEFYTIESLKERFNTDDEIKFIDENVTEMFLSQQIKLKINGDKSYNFYERDKFNDWNYNFELMRIK